MSLLGSASTGLGSVLTAGDVDDGGGTGLAPTLAAVYAAGAAAKPTSDIMAMVNGTKLRFQADVGGGNLPEIALYETTGSLADAASGLPSLGFSLAVDLSIHVGGRNFVGYQIVDPTWNGFLPELDDYSWTIETISAAIAPAGTWNNSNQFGQRQYTAFKNDAPASLPSAGGTNADVWHRLFLYNDLDGQDREIERTTGWGQKFFELSPQSNGITWQWGSHYSPRHVVTPAAGDGLGWGIYDSGMSGGSASLVAGLAAKQVTSNPAGDWAWSMLVADGLGTGGLTEVATFARSGITFNVPVPGLFGSDVLVPLPNSAAVQKTVLELVASYISNVSGAESSKWQIKLLNGAGAQTTALEIDPGQILVPVGTSANPGVAFQGQSNYGMYYTGGSLALSAGGTPRLVITAGAGVQTTSNLPYYVGTGSTEGIGFNGTAAFWLFSNTPTDIALGATGALATTATHGFVDMPSGAGPPTGVPDKVPAGKIACYIDSVGQKMYGYFTGTGWVVI